MKIAPLSASQKIMAVVLCIGIAAAIALSQSIFSANAIYTELDKPLPLAAAAPASAAAEIATPELTAPAVSAKIAAKPGASAATAKIEAWTLGDAKSAIPPTPLSSVIRDYDVIAIDPHPEVTPQSGETVSLPLLNGQKVLVDVQNTNTNPNGDKSWSGHLQGYGEDYPVIMTYGEHSIFAMITTPAGSYTMESTDGVGWLYKNPSELELSDTSSKDFLEIPHSL